MWVGEEMKMAEQHEFLDIAITMARNVSRIQCLQKGGDPKEHWCSILVNELDHLVEENARLTELAAQKASRADELFEFIKYVNSMSGCKAAMSSQEFYGITKEAGRIVDKIKQEGNDE